MTEKFTMPNCGCKVIETEYGEHEIEYCSKHKATDDMYQALKDISQRLYALGENTKIPHKHYTEIKEIYLAIDKILAKADN